MKSLSFILGVAFFHWGEHAHATPVLTNQSNALKNQYLDRPIRDDKSTRGGSDPDLFVSVKYENGLLDEITLAKYGTQRVRGVEGFGGAWAPSVDERTAICTDLCVAGLGGNPCGRSCEILLPPKLLEIQGNSLKRVRNLVEEVDVLENITELNTTTAAAAPMTGSPRRQVCPTLCANNLGVPLCECNDALFPVTFVPSWESVCSTFCSSDGYRLHGCPVCNTTATHQSELLPTSLAMSDRILNTAEGWVLWCNVQCDQGEGGAACNCDRAPFRMV